MKRFLSTLLTASVATLAMWGQTTVQGVPWEGPSHLRKAMAASDPSNPDGDIVIEESDVQFWAGTGSNKSYLVVQWDAANNPSAHVFGYRYDGEKTGWDMISAVAAAHPQLYLLTHLTGYGYTLAGIGLDVNGNGQQLLTLDTNGVKSVQAADKATSLVITNAYNYDNWTPTDSSDLWNSGWYTNGYWSYWTKSSSDETFAYSSVGASTRKLCDGSIDGWIFTSLSGGTSSWKELNFDTAPATQTFKAGEVWYRDVNNMGIGTTAYAVAVAPQAGQAATAGEISIPATVTVDGTERSVSGIEAGAFTNSAVTAVTLQSPLIIGDGAFDGCSQLTSFTATASAPAILGSDIFKGCTQLATVSLPEEWTASYLGEGIFDGCTALTSLSLPAGCTAIPARYARNTGITELTVPETVTSIGNQALACSALTAVKTENRTPATCAADAFAGERATLTVPMGCKDLYAAAEGWKTFSAISEDVPAGYVPVGTKFQVGDLWYVVTSNTPNEVSVAYPAANDPTAYNRNLTNAYNDVVANLFKEGGMNAREWQLRLPVSVEYPEKGTFSVTGIADFAFANVKLPTSKTMTIKTAEGGWNESIRSIGRYAFAGNNSSGISLPPYTASLGEYAFSEMTELVDFACDNPKPLVTEIPAGLCNNDNKLKWCSLLNENTTKVGNKAFYYHSRGFQVEHPLSSLAEVGDQAFYPYYSGNDTKYPILLTSALRKVGNSAFSSCKLSFDGGSELHLYADGSYASNAFASCEGIDKLVAEEGVTVIPSKLFSYASDLTEVVLPSTIETVGSEAFIGIKTLNTVNFPEGLKTIENIAFRNTGITKVDLPASVETCLGIWGNDYLTEINIPSNSKLRQANFGMTGITSIFVPDGMTEMPSFSYCQKLTTVTGARNVVTIPSYCYNATPMTEAYIPKGTHAIGDFAWSSCPNIKEIVIPEGVTTLGGRIAYQATALERIVIPSTVKNFNNQWGSFSGVPVNTDLWMCYSSTNGLKYYSDFMPDTPFGSYAGQKFAHYYVLSGMKADFDKFAAGKLDFIEIPITVDFPEIHGMSSTWDKESELSDIRLEVAPEMAVVLNGTGLAESDIPEAFMAANLKKSLVGSGNASLLTGEYRLRGSSDAWKPFTAKVMAPEDDLLSRALPVWKCILSDEGLTPGAEYEYTVSRTEGTNVIPENRLRYFTAADRVTTGIDAIVIDTENVEIYDLSGNRLSELAKGLNIVIDANGKAHKVMVP